MITARIAPETVMTRVRHCVVRPQEHSYLVYNQRTDELHLLPPEAYLVYGFCDGLNTAADIEDYICSLTEHSREEVRARLYELLDKLVVRGLLEVEQPC